MNLGRQREIDLAKGFTIILMVLCHAWLELIPGDTESIAYLIAVCLFHPVTGAPLFMVCMGIGHTYSRNKEPKLLAKRGVILLLLGYLLNFCSKVVPQAFGVFVLHTGEKVDWLYAFFDVDIMQFAGLAFLFLAFVTYVKMRTEILLLISIGMSALGCLLMNVSTGNALADCFAGLIWGTGNVSEFAFLYWMTFPAFGMLFGEKLKKCVDKDAFYKKIMLVTLPLTIGVYILQFFTLDDLVGNEFYWMGPFREAQFIVAGMFFVSLCHFMGKRMPGGCIKFLQGLSSRINSVYAIHWVILGWLAVVWANYLAKGPLPWYAAYIATVPIVIVSNLISIVWKKMTTGGQSYGQKKRP